MLISTWLNAVRNRFVQSPKSTQTRIRERKRRPLGSLAWVEALESRWYLAAVAWDGGGDGSHWSDPLNWSGNTLPGEADDVTINFGSNTIQHNSGTDTVHSLTTTNPFELAGGALSVVTTTHVNNFSTINGGTLLGGMVDSAAHGMEKNAIAISTRRSHCQINCDPTYPSRGANHER